MDLLRITTSDFILTVTAEGVKDSFNRAAQRNTNLISSTKYCYIGSPTPLFELITLENNRISDSFNIQEFNSSTFPVFFENKDYLFEVEFLFTTDNEPFIFSPLKEIRHAFIPRKRKGFYFLTGIINYGNNIGKTDFILRYYKDNLLIEVKFQFEVFPIKLDYKNDYNQIIKDIDKEFSLLVLDILKKTYSGFYSHGINTNDIIWWNIFGGLYKDILQAAKLILNKPHNRLINEFYYSKADQIKDFNPLLEENIIEHKKEEFKYYRINKKTLTVDTKENQFVKHALTSIATRYRNIKSRLLGQFQDRLSAEFIAELDLIERKLGDVIQNPLFKKISRFKGLNQESLVLQQGIGYSALYKKWIILKKGIEFFEGINKFELRNIAELYQIWCFIHIKKLISNLLNKPPEEINLADLIIDGFILRLRKGRLSRVSFKNNNGDIIELYHEMKFSDIKDSDLEKVGTFTTHQVPDIVLRVTKEDLKEAYEFTYLFDAKYRLMSEDDKKFKNLDEEYDFPPDDAINQMHRYRDAIYYHHKNERPKKEVIGAYILFPGLNTAEETKKLYYHESIKNINIGAFELVPGERGVISSSILENYLKSILIDKNSENILHEDIIAQKGMKYEDPNSMVFLAFISKNNQVDYFKTGKATIYHMPLNHKNGSTNSIKNIDKLKYFAPIIDGIVEYYEISNIKILPRNEVFPISHNLNSDSIEAYYVFEIYNRKILKNKIQSTSGGNRVFRYAKLSDLKSSRSINDFVLRQNI